MTNNTHQSSQNLPTETKRITSNDPAGQNGQNNNKGSCKKLKVGFLDKNIPSFCCFDPIHRCIHPLSLLLLRAFIMKHLHSREFNLPALIFSHDCISQKGQKHHYRMQQHTNKEILSVGLQENIWCERCRSFCS